VSATTVAGDPAQGATSPGGGATPAPKHHSEFRDVGCPQHIERVSPEFALLFCAEGTQLT